MGIYDREYIRRESAPRPGGYGGGFRAMRMWSCNTWIIVICVAVFVIDGFLPTRYLGTGRYQLFDGVTSVPRSAVIDKAAGPQWRPSGTRIPLEDSDVLPMGGVIDAGTRPVVVRLRDARGARDALVQPLLSRTGGTQIGWAEVMPPVLMPLLATKGGRQIGWAEMQEFYFFESFLHFSTERGFFKIEFWRLVGFQFLHTHGTIAHILFNMLGLYFFGPMVERYLGSKRYLAFYLLCGIFGALMYVVLNLGGLAANRLFGFDGVPVLLFNDISTPLIGASAGVYGVLMAGAFLAPNATVLLFFILPMRLKTLAYAIVVIAFLTIIFGGENAGGEAGHLGGAIAGFYFIRRPHHLHGFFDILGRIDPTSHHYRTKGLAARGRAAAKGARAAFGGRGAGREQIDRVLDKINARGLQSLTDKEKRILREASDKEG
ncbi:MAG: rhomboid family intramembrane serine protease [Phycisphaerales bacterium]|nr:MAG: rhomboid family intramembrane serine protease [Phycisphaerales bacterium]